MEANHSDIEREERRTAKIGAREDREELEREQRRLDRAKYRKR